jgi:hypothetical protein
MVNLFQDKSIGGTNNGKFFIQGEQLVIHCNGTTYPVQNGNEFASQIVDYALSYYVEFKLYGLVRKHVVLSLVKPVDEFARDSNKGAFASLPTH